MFQIEWPWALLLLPLPLLVYLVMPVRGMTQQAALRVPFIDDFRLGVVELHPLEAKRWCQWISLLAWVLLVFSASRPQWLGDSIAIVVSGRDLMIAVDLSDSMRTGDFEIEGEKVNRLFATKWVARDFIERRRGDRLGLILFGSRAYLQTPLTFDTRTIQRLLQEAVIGLAGERTAIGDAIGLAIKRLDDGSDNARVLILMTDGANTAGEVTPIKAAQLAAARGLKIYTIGIGADEVIETTWFGLRMTSPAAQLDEKSLRSIAGLTGGRYFRARDSEELARIYRLLDELEPLPRDEQTLRPISALFMWPLALALTLALFILWQQLRRAL